MKLRIRGDSLRLRLTKSEVTTLAEGGVVEESIAFGEGAHERLTYAIVLGEANERPLAAKLSATRIEVKATPNAIRDWANSDEAISLEAVQKVTGERSLRILVEKDFACLRDRPLEDDSDAFPNPKGAC